MTVFGTRPEAIKMAPIIKKLEADTRFESCVVVTAQHREMLDQVLEIFSIVPDHDLDIMQPNQTLASITSTVLTKMDELLDNVKPDIILVHGDTTTTFAASMAAFYHQIPLAHVEAGLRTWNKYSPFPEEMNRQMTDCLTDIYFAPTIQSKANLLIENHESKNIFVTGNTVIDALAHTIKEVKSTTKKKQILLTVHRRENLGENMRQIFLAINHLVTQFKDIEIILPMHKNPKVRQIIDEVLVKSNQIQLIEPLDVVEFHNLANQSTLILTDSGGVQEEAPSMGVPVLVLRDTTERPEGVEAGTLKLVGTNTEDIIDEVSRLLTNTDSYKQMSQAQNPYGDGLASERICDILDYVLNQKRERPIEWNY